MSKNRNRGKALERFIAKDLGGRRVGILGKADVELPGMILECKERKRLPRFIAHCFEQVEKYESKLRRGVVLHELGQEHDEDIVMVRLKHFREILGRLKEET